MDAIVENYRSWILNNECDESKLLSTPPNHLLPKAAWLKATILRHLYEKLVEQKKVLVTGRKFFYRSGELPIKGFNDEELLGYCENAYFCQLTNSFNGSVVAAERGYRVEARSGLRFMIESANRLTWLKLEPEKVKKIANEKIEYKKFPDAKEYQRIKNFKDHLHNTASHCNLHSALYATRPNQCNNIEMINQYIRYTYMDIFYSFSLTFDLLMNTYDFTIDQQLEIFLDEDKRGREILIGSIPEFTIEDALYS